MCQLLRPSESAPVLLKFDLYRAEGSGRDAFRNLALQFFHGAFPELLIYINYLDQLWPLKCFEVCCRQWEQWPQQSSSCLHDRCALPIPRRLRTTSILRSTVCGRSRRGRCGDHSARGRGHVGFLSLTDSLRVCSDPGLAIAEPSVGSR